MKNNFLPLVRHGEVTGVNIIDKEMVLDNEKVISYGHAEFDHIQLVLAELKKENLAVDYCFGIRNSVYLFDPSWEPSENTKVIPYKGKTVAFEKGFLVHFFAKNGTAKPLIEFFTHRCFKNGCNNSIAGSWEVPYLVLDNIKNTEFIPTDEYILPVSKERVQSCFVHDEFNSKIGWNKKVSLFEPFAKFVREIDSVVFN